MWRTARRIGRIAAWIALSAILLGLVAATTLILWARSASGRRIILSTAISAAQKQLAGRLTIDGLEGDLTRSITLRRIRVYDREQKLAVAVDAVRIEHDLVGLLSREVRVRSLEVEGARVHVRWLQGGQLNVAALTKERATEPQPQPENTTSSRGGRWKLAIEALRVQAEVAIHARPGQPPLRGRLELAGGVQWRASAPAFHQVRASFVTDGRDLDALQSVAQLAVPLRATLSLDGPHDALESEVVVQAAGGEIRARAHASMPLGGALAWRATVQSRDVDPGAVLIGAPHGHIEIAAHARGAGKNAAIAIDALTFDVADTRASARGTVELGARLTADLRADAYSPDLARLTGLGLPDLHGRIEAHAHVRRTSSHTYVDASTKARELRVDTLHVARIDTRMHADEAHVELRLAAAGPHDLRADVRAHGAPLREDGRWGVDLALDAFTIGTHGDVWRLTAPGRVRVDGRAGSIALALAAHDQTLALDGKVARDSGRLDFHLRGDHLDAGPMARLVDVEVPSTAVDVDARLRGTRAAPELDLTIHGRTLPWPRHDLPAVAFHLDAVADGRRVRSTFEAAAAGQSLRAIVDAPLVAHGHAPLFAEVRASKIDLESLGPLLPPRFRSLTGQADFDAHLSGTTHDPHLVAHLAVPHWTLGAPSTELRAGVVELTLDVRGTPRSAKATVTGAVDGHRFLTAQGESRFDVERLIERRRWQELPVTADVTIPSFELARLGQLGGAVEGSAHVRGTLAHPVAEAELHGRDLRLSDLHLTKLDLRAGWDRGTLTASVDGAEAAGGRLHLDAQVPAAADAPVRATLTADAFTFAIDDVGEVRRLEGVLDANLEVSGSRARPAVSGFLRIDHGAFAGGTDPRLFRDLAVDLVAHEHHLELRRLSMRVGRGELKAHGRVALDGITPNAIDLVAEAERFPFDATNAEAWINGTVDLHGHRVGDRIEGTLTVSQGNMQLPNLQNQRQLQSTDTLDDVVYVDEPTPPRADGAGRHLPPLALHVVAHLPGPFKIDSPELHAELRGEIELRSVDGALGLYGHAETTAGHIELLGREYEIERARASFDGEIDPVLDVRLTRALSDTTVIISVHGTAKSPTLELASDPPVYNASQVLGIIVSGDPDNARIDSASVDQQLAGAISQVLVSQLKARLMPSLPLDVIKLHTTASDDTFGLPSAARIEAGTYLRHNIYVSYSHHFGATMTDLHRSNAHEVAFEYRIRRHAILGVRYGDAGIGAIDFVWALRY